MDTRRGSACIVVGLVLLALGAGGLSSCAPEFVPIPSGSFVMGSPSTELGRDDDESQHGVALTHAFENTNSEVTQAQFKDLMGYNPSFFPEHGDGSLYPVDQVSWFDALAFANRFSASSGYAACYVLSDIVCGDGSVGDEAGGCWANGGIKGATVALNGVASIYECAGYRLPTEAEWEYAARAGTTTAFPRGDITCTSCTPADPNLAPIAWFCGNAGTKATHPVKSKAPNAWGLYDTAGNVEEWTWDWYARQWAPGATDPEGPASGYYRVVRGGAAWYHGAARCRSADRAGHTPGYRDKHLGFRVVRTTGASNAVVVPAVVREGASAAADKGSRTTRLALGNEPLSPRSLPFDLTRPDIGTPLTPEEISAFTAKVTGFWRDVGYFDWVSRVSHGMDASNPYGMPEYKLYWQDVRAVKAGGAVTFEHVGFADNLTIPTPKLLMNAGALYLATGDPSLGGLVEQLSKGMVAGFMGMLWDLEDPELDITARTIFTQDHGYLQDGRQTYVSYGPAKFEQIDWNAQTIPNHTNPYWGDIWVRNWRSKDDVPHILRSVPTLLRLAAEAPDAPVRDAAMEAAVTLQRFARDMVDTGYYIRSKDRNGDEYVPLNPNGMVADLASFVEYSWLLPYAECAPKVAAGLIGYGDTHGIDCGTGFGDLYEYIATAIHYYNYDIIRYFHAAAITNALVAGQDDLAHDLLEGMVARIDEMMAGTAPNSDDPDWPSDVASFLLVAASGGLPLTSAETRHVVEQYSLAVDHYAVWPNWDLWAPSVSDGQVAWEPDRGGSPQRVVEITEMVYPFEYCSSPWFNGTGSPLFDCEIVLDPDRWGEGR